MNLKWLIEFEFHRHCVLYVVYTKQSFSLFRIIFTQSKTEIIQLQVNFCIDYHLIL